MQNEEKSYVDRLNARKLLDFSLFKILFEFLMAQSILTWCFIDLVEIFNHMLSDGSKTSQQFRKFRRGTRA